MTTNQHPLTETAAAEITDEMVEAGASYAWEEANPGILGWNSISEHHKEGCRRDARAVLTAALALNSRRWRECRFDDIEEGERVRWAFAENEHGTFEMTEGVAHEMRRRKGDREWVDAGGNTVACAPAHGTEGFRYWRFAGHENTAPTPPAEPLARTLLAVPKGYGAPHHNAKEIKRDDYVMQVDRDGYTRAGRVHYQDGSGNWRTKDGVYITWAARRADRPDALTVWPAPTPPAEEVELPGEFGAVVLDPRWGVRSYTRAVHLGEGVWAAEVTPGADVYTHLVRDLRSATLPDGTRARRDGEHEDGTPRFVKDQEGEK